MLLGRDNSVCIATRYGLDGQWIESRWGRNFLHPSRPALAPTQPPIQRVPGLSRGKEAGAWRLARTPSSAEVKERVELYLYSPPGPSWTVLVWPLPLLRCLQYPFRRSRFTYDKRAVNRAIPVGLSISPLFRKETSWGSSALRCVINLSGRESNELLLKKTFSAGEKRSACTVWMWVE